jgi:hypothetical protein
VSDSVTTATRGVTSLRSCALLLTVALVLVIAIIAAVNTSWHGLPGLAAAGIAGVLVAIGMYAALGITGLGASKNKVEYALGSQLVRLAVPLAGGLWLQEAFPVLGKAGVLACVLAIYLPTLVVETILAVRMIGGMPRGVRHG